MMLSKAFYFQIYSSLSVNTMWYQRSSILLHTLQVVLTVLVLCRLQPSTSYHHGLQPHSTLRPSSCRLQGTVNNAQKYEISTISKRLMQTGSILSLLVGMWQVSPAQAASAEYTVEQCFDIVQRELTQRKPFIRIEHDIQDANWQDLKVFTKEYDGFRGSILKGAAKQLKGDDKKVASDLANKVMYDLIGINKAARKEDAEAATQSLQGLEKDIQEFYDLKAKLGLQ